MKRLALLLILPALVACTSLHQVMGSSMGNHKDELIKSWGPPTTIHNLDDGGQVLLYVRQGAVAVPIGSMVYVAPVTCEKQFNTDRSGYIVSWIYRGC